MSKRNQTGFTLLEILVVIAIIVLMAGIMTMGLLPAKGKAKTQTTRALIANIQGALESYFAAYGDYPPTDLSDLYPGTSNGTNNGIESVVACLSVQEKGGPFLIGLQESRYANLDGDSTAVPPVNWWFGDTQLREIVDLWNNPFVYFHYRDYDNPSAGNNYSFRKVGDAISPQRSSATATYYNAFTFQIWSAGPDEKNDNGLRNDVNNWK
ncbi:MAG: type II secretion system protein [Planctomycetota bacterium]|nr:type II secretion system protein [Planctomycetota bacterium]MDI6787979.1 type II secretion system protein [Planctomycetota bacterium]